MNRTDTSRGRLVVDVTAAPEPGLLRPALAAVLAGRPWPAGPEADIARAVRAAVHGDRGPDEPAAAAEAPERSSS